MLPVEDAAPVKVSVPLVEGTVEPRRTSVVPVIVRAFAPAVMIPAELDAFPSAVTAPVSVSVPAPVFVRLKKFGSAFTDCAPAPAKSTVPAPPVKVPLSAQSA